MRYDTMDDYAVGSCNNDRNQCHITHTRHSTR